MYLSLSEEGTILDVNDLWLDFMGYPKQEVLGRFYADFVTPSSFPTLEQSFFHLKKNGQIDNVHIRLKKSDGSIAEAVLNGVSICDQQSFLDRIHSVLRDMDLYMRSEHSIKEMIDISQMPPSAQGFVQGVLDSQTNLIIILANHRITFANRALLNFFRVVSLNELPGTPGWLFDKFETGSRFHIKDPAQRDEWLKALQKLHKTERVVCMKDPQNMLHTFQIDINTLTLSDGPGYVLTFSDITQTSESRPPPESDIESIIAELINKETLLSQTEQIAQIGSWEWDFKTNKILCSDGLYRLFALEKGSEDLSIGRLLRYLHADDRERVKNILKKSIRSKHATEFKCRIVLPGGSVKQIKVAANLNYLHAKPTGFIGIVSDITSQHASEEKFREQHAFLQTVIDGVDDTVMVIHADYSVELMNAALQKNIRSSTVSDKKHPKCYELAYQRSTPCDGVDHPCPLADVLKSGAATSVLHTYDGKYIELSASPLKNDQGDTYAIVESARDITPHLKIQDELRMEKQVLSFHAEHDRLTGLPNRTLFFDRLHQSIKNARRSYTKAAVLFIDLDHFKEINDTLGHAVGDKLLIEVSNRLYNCVREVDTIARLGGDEFTVILESIHQLQDVAEIADKLLRSLQKPLYIDTHELYVTTSIGISIYPDDDETPEELLHHADSAMYKAKQDGRNCFQFYTANMTDRAFERVVMENCLHQALKDEGFVVYYQPQFDAANNTITGVEALVRWKHNEMGIIPPSKFIPLAKETGFIQQIDQWVLKNALTQVVQWYGLGLNPGHLCLNVTLEQLHQDDFLMMLESLLKETNCKPQWLTLEITEKQIMQEPERTIMILQKISNLGVSLALDGFGAGSSSLPYLIRLPLSKLKIDQSFVRDIPDNAEDTAIIRSVIAMSDSMNLKTVAVGVENEKQKKFLLEAKCSDIQGYLYAEPMPAEEMAKWLRTS